MSSSDADGEGGQYEDDSDDQKRSGGGGKNDEDGQPEKKAESSEDEAPRKKSKKKKKIQDDDDDDDDKGDNSGSDAGSDKDASPAARKKKKKTKKIKKGKKREDGRRYLDEAAEESDGEGGVRRVDDEDDDDDDEEDDLRLKRKRKGAFIVSDDEEEEVAPKKEKVVFTEREKRLDRDDYELIKENVGLDMRPMDESDSEDDEEEDDPNKPKRKRLKRGGGRDEDEDDDVGMKVSKKKGSRGLEEALFAGGGADDDADRVEDRQQQHKRSTMYDVDSDSSMDSFIERDLDDEDRGGFDGEGRGKRQKQKRKTGSGPLGQDRDHAVDLFGEFFDDDFEEQDMDEDRNKDSRGMPETNKLEDLYEPALIEQFYMSKEDDRIRKTDVPERLQIDLADRVPLNSKEDAMNEAEWIFENEIFKATHQAREHINEDEDVEVVYDDPEIIHDEASADKARVRMKRSEMARTIRERLIQKICNVLCYLRGVENVDIQHGPISLQTEHGEGEEDWDREKGVTPIFDIPFIAHYRREYWEPELSYEDLWRVLDADLQWSNLQKKKERLIDLFKAARDEVCLFVHACMHVCVEHAWYSYTCAM